MLAVLMVNFLFHPMTHAVIAKLAMRQSEWVTICCNHEVGEDEDNYMFDPMQLASFQISTSSDGKLLIATDECIIVLNTNDGKEK